MPVNWDNLERVYPTDFTLRTAPGILEAEGDPWAGILAAKQDLGELLEATQADAGHFLGLGSDKPARQVRRED